MDSHLTFCCRIRHLCLQSIRRDQYSDSVETHILDDARHKSSRRWLNYWPRDVGKTKTKHKLIQRPRSTRDPEVFVYLWSCVKRGRHLLSRLSFLCHLCAGKLDHLHLLRGGDCAELCVGHITLDSQIALNFQHCSSSRSKDRIGQLSRTEIIMMVTSNNELMRFSCIKPLEAAVASDKSCTGTVCFALLSLYML